MLKNICKNELIVYQKLQKKNLLCFKIEKNAYKILH